MEDTNQRLGEELRKSLEKQQQQQQENEKAEETMTGSVYVRRREMKDWLQSKRKEDSRPTSRRAVPGG